MCFYMNKYNQYEKLYDETKVAFHRCATKYVFLKILQKFTGKHLRWSLFLIQLPHFPVNFVNLALLNRC